ncbi:hypothetical protein PENSPDRAFT_680511 [Peniophora sp. CONT]|nr:hypothetical protein PENSPDRAFT_680511 [Peniophora sp. CONT]
MVTGLTHDYVLVFYIYFVTVVSGQNLTVPGTWRKPSSDLDREMREHLAYEAAVPLSQIDTLGSNDLPRVQDITSIYALLALQDYYSGNSTWLNSTGTDNLQAYIKKNGLYGIGQQLYSDVSYWGLTFFYTYRTYKEQFLLDYAVSAWNTIYSDAFVTPDDAAKGLAVWANVTQNHTLATLLETVIPTITTFPVWSLQSGVVNEPDSTASADRILKGLYIRGLAEARMRNPGTDLARYIEAYITVQFNAILDNAQAPAPNDSYYSTSWIGAESYDASGNIAALDVLNAAFSFLPSMSSAGNSSTSSSSPSPTSIAMHSKSSRTGAIAGGVVGGVVAAVAAITVVLLCRRRRRTGANDISNENEDDNAGRMHSVEPFTSRQAYNLTASKSERVNSATQQGAPSLVASPPVSVQEPARHQGVDQEETGIAELPSLIQRLNNLLQGRQGELPPQYDD